MIIRSSVDVVYGWTIMKLSMDDVHGRLSKSGRFNRPYDGRTNVQYLGKSDMLERLINP